MACKLVRRDPGLQRIARHFASKGDDRHRDSRLGPASRLAARAHNWGKLPPGRTAAEVRAWLLHQLNADIAMLAPSALKAVECIASRPSPELATLWTSRRVKTPSSLMPPARELLRCDRHRAERSGNKGLRKGRLFMSGWVCK